MNLTITQSNDMECYQLLKLLIPLDTNIEKKVNYIQNNYGLNFKESLEYIVTDSPVLWSKVYLDWEARDYQADMLKEMKASRSLVLRLGRRLGKCLAPSSLILDSKTGQYNTIESLYQKQEEVNLFALDTNKQKLVNTTTNIITDNGIKPVYRVTTTSGRVIECTSNHPFYCFNEYKELSNLNKGDYVSIAKIPEPLKTIHIKDDIIIFLAYMIGDGCCVHNAEFTNNTPIVIDEMREITTNLNCDFHEEKQKYNYYISGINGGYNYCLDILKQYGLHKKKSVDKTIPKEIFSLNNEQLSLFINRLYSTDGWATYNISNKKRIEIGYSTASKELAIQLQSLLLRFGINSVISKKKNKSSKESDKYFDSYTVGIYSVSDLNTFIDKIGIYGRQKQINEIKEILPTINSYGNNIPIAINKIIEKEINIKGISKQELRNNTGYRFDTRYSTVTLEKVKRANEYIQSKEIQKYIDSDIIWDEVKSVDYIGDMQTYDFTVPIYHNFVCNDFITHNTECMCIAILWHAYTQKNKGPNNQYDILVFTPYETQIDLIFKRIHQLIDLSPVLKGLISRDVHHNIQFNINGVTSNVLGLTAGANNSSGGANSSRGQRADLLILDECDYIGSNQITNIINIRNEAPDRIKIIAASTPSGKHEEYYKWCTGASKRYYPKKEDIEKYQFTGYEIDEKQGNGWTEIYSPSMVNHELLKINPDTSRTYLEDLKTELTSMRYEQEVMAGFGEEEMGVYQKKYIRAAIDEGVRLGHTYLTKLSHEDIRSYVNRKKMVGSKFMLGVDWDRTGADTHMVGIEYDPIHFDLNNDLHPVFKVILHETIPRGEFTMTNGVNKIIDLNEDFHFDYIGVDRGFGDTQIEMLHKYGMNNPSTGLATTVTGIQFSQKVDVRDPYTGKKNEVPVKPFMVNNSVNLFEKCKMVLEPTDKFIIEELEEYRIKSYSTIGLPIYTDINEHAIDCINLCLLMFALNEDELLKKMYAMAAVFIEDFDRRDLGVMSRAILGKEPEDNDHPIIQVIKASGRSEVIALVPVNHRKSNARRNNVYKRRSF